MSRAIWGDRPARTVIISKRENLSPGRGCFEGEPFAIVIQAPAVRAKKPGLCGQRIMRAKTREIALHHERSPPRRKARARRKGEFDSFNKSCAVKRQCEVRAAVI